MHIRIKWMNAIIFIVVMIIMAAFGGFAGYLSFVISMLLPIYAVVAIIHLVISWNILAYHQSFSTNHPLKGEKIKFAIELTNEGHIPLCGGTCKFTVVGNENVLTLPVGALPGTKKTIEYQTEICCPYRGTYTAGIESITLSTPLGIIQTEMEILPQVFYVYPEVCELNSSLEQYTESSGVTVPGSIRGGSDMSIFEYVVPLREEMPGARICWKRWASTGIPSAIITGRAKSKGLSIVLDLYHLSVSDEERLPCEDMVISAAFSVIHYLVLHDIPVLFSCGSGSAKSIDSESTWQALYDSSTNILFDDDSFPRAAFDDETGSILFSCRPLSELYSSYEKSLYVGNEPHMFICPPLVNQEEEKRHADLIRDKRYSVSSKSLFYVADVTSTIKEAMNAFLNQ